MGAACCSESSPAGICGSIRFDAEILTCSVRPDSVRFVCGSCTIRFDSVAARFDSIRVQTNPAAIRFDSSFSSIVTDCACNRQGYVVTPGWQARNTVTLWTGIALPPSGSKTEDEWLQSKAVRKLRRTLYEKGFTNESFWSTGPRTYAWRERWMIVADIRKGKPTFEQGFKELEARFTELMDE